MNKLFCVSSFRLIAAAALAVATPFSIAGGHPDVNWSVSIGSPYPAPQVYAAPPVVYVQPQPVYVRPRPVYVQPPAFIQYGPGYYVDEGRRGMGRRHWKHHHRHGHHD